MGDYYCPAVIFLVKLNEVNSASICISPCKDKDIHFILGKQVHQPVTIKEFADYMGMKVEEVEQAIT